MSDFDVADVVPTSTLTEDQISKASGFTWVHRWIAWVLATDYASEASTSGFKIWTTQLLQLQYI